MNLSKGTTMDIYIYIGIEFKAVSGLRGCRAWSRSLGS